MDSTTNLTGSISACGAALKERNIISFPHALTRSLASVPTVGTLIELDYLPRNANTTVGTYGLCEWESADICTPQDGYTTIIFPNAVFANGSAIPDGMYRFLLRALKPTGDAGQEADYESWLSPVIGVVKS